MTISQKQNFDDALRPRKLLHADASSYLRDVIHACAERSSTNSDDIDFQEQLEAAVSHAIDEPDALFQSHPELEQLAKTDEEAFRNAVYDIVIYNLIHDGFPYEDWDNYEGCWKEEQGWLELDDVTAYCRELLQIANEAIETGDAEEVVAALDALIDFSGVDIDPDGEVEHWADALAQSVD